MELAKNLLNIKSLETFKGRLKGKKVFLRADFNVPIQDGKIADAYRIDTTMKTFAFLKDEGAITIVASHIETKDIDSPTLKPVFEYIQSAYPEYVVTFCENFLDTDALQTLLNSAYDGNFILLENIRNAKGEGMSEKGDDAGLAEYLKSFVEFYINDAFAVSHRAHTTVSKLPSLFAPENKVAGLQLFVEIQSLSGALNPKTPFATILSGAKFSTKLPLIEKYLKTADLVFVGGALYNNIVKSLGHEVGVSLIDSEATYVDAMVADATFLKKVFVPNLVTVRDTVSGTIRETNIAEVHATESIQDIAVSSIQEFVRKIEDMKTQTVLWNGPVGNFETTPFDKGTVELGKELLAYAQKNRDIQLIVGGGDTVSAIKDIVELAVQPNVFISTGGGAMLEFLEKEGRLPGIVSLL